MQTVNQVSPVDGNISLDQDDIPDGTTYKQFSATEKSKLAGIEAGAEVNNISDVNATDLTDGGETTLHIHDGRYYTETETNSLLSGKQDSLGFTPENISNKVTSFQVTPDDSHYPSEKLVKDSLDGKQATGNYFNKTTDDLDDISDGTTYVKSENNFSDTYKAEVDKHENNIDILKDPTGFTAPESVTVTYDPGTRKITLTGTVVAYYKGVLISALTNGWESAAHDAGVTTDQFLYYNGSAFVWSSTPWTFENLMIALVTFEADGTYTGTLRECHGLMPWEAHREFHKTIGTYRDSGGVISGVTLNSTTAAQRRPDVSECHIFDEDLKTVLPILNSKSYTQCYLTAQGTVNFLAAQSDIVPLSTNQPYYNQYTTEWVQTLVPNNHYMAVWLFALPMAADATSQARRFIWLQGQRTSSNLADIQALTPSNITYGNLALIFPEIIVIGKVILRYTAANWTLTEVTNLTGTRYNQVSQATGNYLATVSTDSTLTGQGTAGSPLAVNYTGIANKASIADNDRFLALDSADSNIPKYNLWSLVKSTLKTYFDTLYNGILTFGIANTNAVKIDSADVTSGEIARFTANGLESRTNAELKTQLAYLTDLIDDTTPQLYADLDCNEKDLDNVKNIIHDQATASDFTIQNIDLDKDIIFSCNDGGSQTEIMILDGSAGQLSGYLKATTGVISASSTIPETVLSFTDVTTGNASTSNHGYLPKLNNSSTQYLNGQGNWATPAGGGGATLWAEWTGASRTSDAVISSTTHLPVGTAIRYKATGGTYRYGKVLSLSTDAHSILGYPCTTSDDDVFEYDSSGLKSDTITIHLADNFNDADDDALLLNDLNMKLGYRPALCGEFYLVGITTCCKSADTSSDPDINIVQFGTTNKIFSADVNTDLARATSANTVEVTNNYYALNLDSSLDISVDKVGAGDAYDADVEFHFVRA